MNKIHNVIWSTAQNAWVVVAEGTKRSSKSGAKALSVMIALIVLSPAGASAATLPQGGVISVGEGSIVNSGGNQLVIKQTTDKLGVNWQSFNVGPDGQVVFEQPNSKSVALNRVVGSDASAVLGKIDANGQVILINPNGVIVGKDAQVNVGGLVASTLNLSDEKFKKGDYSFTAEGGKNGEVLNQGTIQATEGGYVALLGKSVKNHGIIKARLGTAALAAGNAVTLDFAGDGLLNIQVKESAVNALAENKGLIKADGGSVLMTARASNALLDTVVNNEGVIEAQTLSTRKGKIFLDGGMDSGTVQVAGTLDASAPVQGDGGFIETSGANVKIKDGTKVTTLSTDGKTGDWLVDPTDFHVVSGFAPQTSSQIGALTLSSNLASTNVTLQTSATDIGEMGDINIDSDVSWLAGTKLTLTAHNKVNFNATVWGKGSNAGLVINAPSGITVAPTKRVRLTGANSTFSMNGVNYTGITSVDDLPLLSNAADGQHFFLADDIYADDTSGWNAGAGYIPPGGWGRGVVEGLVLEGLGNTIYNLHINLANDYAGLIGRANNASIQNINVLRAEVSGFSYSGILAGYLSNSTVTNVNTSGNVHGINGDDVGGILGHALNVQLKNVSNSTFFSSSATGRDNVGGIIGYAENSSLFNTGSGIKVTGDNFAGGLIGSSLNTDVLQSYAYGNVYGLQATGGLIGKASGGTVSQAYSNGWIYGQTQTGGLIGNAINSTINYATTDGRVSGTSYTGGLIGDLSGGSIHQAFSMSWVSGTDSVGGFAGRNVSGLISNAYARGDVTGTSNVGGFLGSVDSSTIEFTYSLGAVTGGLNVGGYSGSGAGNSISESFWDAQTSGQATSAHGLGKTTAQMHAASTFSNWDVGTEGGTGETWRIYDGFTSPLLRFTMTEANVSGNDKNLTYSSHAVTEAELNASGVYGYTTGIWAPDGFWMSWLDDSYIQGGNTHDGGQAIRDAGTYTADKFYSSQWGFDLIETAPKTIIIDKANLTFSATGIDKTYDGTANAGVMFSDNRLGSDDLVIGATSKTFADKNAGAGKTITVNGITIGGADANNYTWSTSSTTTTANINKANLVVSASGSNKTYDGTTSASVSLGDNRIAGDTLTVTSGGGTFADKNAGSAKGINVGGIVVSGTDAGNYNWNSTASTTADITKAALNITATGNSKTYDGTTTASATLADNRFGSDALVITSTGQAFANKNAGVGKTLTVSGIAVTGADAGNYTWNTSATTTANIAKAALNVTATGVNRTYDGSTFALANLNDDRIGSDNLALSMSGANFADKNAGLVKVLTVSGINVTGADAGNYTWNSTALATADIAKASLVVKAQNANKVEGDVDGPLNWSIQSGSLFGVDAINGVLSRAAGESVGQYAINKGSLDAGVNYDLAFVAGTYEINAASIPPVTPPVVTPPVVTPPVVTPKPPVVTEPTRPVVNDELEQTKSIIANVSVAAKGTGSNAPSVAMDASSLNNPLGDYRMVNLGMKLPEELQE
jgi:filamentous hemagglutinin family protein